MKSPAALTFSAPYWFGFLLRASWNLASTMAVSILLACWFHSFAPYRVKPIAKKSNTVLKPLRRRFDCGAAWATPPVEFEAPSSNGCWPDIFLRTGTPAQYLVDSPPKYQTHAGKIVPLIFMLHEV